MGSSIVHVSEACICGGRTDGTPSGIKRHEATAKHAGYIVSCAELGISPATGQMLDAIDTANLDAAAALAETPAITLPVMDYSAQTEIWLQQRAINAELATVQAERKRRNADLQWRVNRPEQYTAEAIAKYAEKVRRLDQSISDLEQDVANLGDKEDAIRQAQHAEFEAGWVAVTEHVLAGYAGSVERIGDREMFNAWMLDGNIMVKQQGEGDFEIALHSGEWGEYEGHAYPKEEFGYSGRISAPRSYRIRADEEKAPFTLSFGSYSGNKTSETARQMIRVMGVTIWLLDALNAIQDAN